MNGHSRVTSRLAIAIAVAFVAGCADRSVSPVEALADRPTFALSGTAVLGDVTVSQIIVVPNATTTFVVGGEHKLKIPAGSVCDPAVSTYGATEWDNPCQTLRAPLAITARSWRNAEGHPRIEFQPALRFVPTDKGVVTLYMMDKQASADPRFTILFCNAANCIDESLIDPSVATMRDRSNGFAYRQLKHFSGYMVGAGRMSVEAEASLFE